MNDKIRPLLLVEDNPMDADLMRRSFSRRHFEHPIQLVCDGEEALAFIRRWETGETLPMAILLDLNLPKVNGIEVLCEIEANPACRDVPTILLISSQADREMLAPQVGERHPFIVKPVSYEKFVEVGEQMGFSWEAGQPVD
jgi:CheY-like chemotaxis protein